MVSDDAVALAVTLAREFPNADAAKVAQAARTMAHCSAEARLHEERKVTDYIMPGSHEAADRIIRRLQRQASQARAGLS